MTVKAEDSVNLHYFFKLTTYQSFKFRILEEKWIMSDPVPDCRVNRKKLENLQRIKKKQEAKISKNKQKKLAQLAHTKQNKQTVFSILWGILLNFVVFFSGNPSSRSYNFVNWTKNAWKCLLPYPAGNGPWMKSWAGINSLTWYWI